MALWIYISIAAAFMQNLRSALQKSLSDDIGTMGATYARFLFALPFTPIYAWAIGPGSGTPFPDTNLTFFMHCIIGATAQVLATAALIHSFTYRNFAVGTTFSQTATIQAAIIGFIVLGEGVTLYAGLGILVSFFGILALSAQDGERSVFSVLGSLGQPAALYGLLSGLMFGISSITYRAASLSLGEDQSMFVNASMSLVVAQAWQVLIMSLWFLVRSPETIMQTIRAWRLALPIGFAGMWTSVGWFTAMALYNAAYVRAVGQIELVFTIAASVLFFRERVTLREIVGITLVGGGIALLVLLG